jgi:hypothetical protein
MSRIEGSRSPTYVPARQEPTPPPPAPEASAPATSAQGYSGQSSFQAAPARAPGEGPTSTPVSRDLGVQPQDQGNTNACGTTSLAAVMSHFGKPRTHDQIDESIRAFNMFTAPDKLVEYARGNGMRAEIKADANMDDLAKMVDQGAPPIVLIDPGAENDATLHYVTVTGYNRDASGKITDVTIADSASNSRYSIPAEEFEKKWDSLKMGNVPTGLNNVMITTVPDDGRSITGADGVSRKASEIELPKSDLSSDIKSGFARIGANAVSNVTEAVDKVVDGAKAAGGAVKKAWDSLWD